MSARTVGYHDGHAVRVLEGPSSSAPAGPLAAYGRCSNALTMADWLGGDGERREINATEREVRFRWGHQPITRRTER